MAEHKLDLGHGIAGQVNELKYWGNTMNGTHLLVCQRSEAGDRSTGRHILQGNIYVMLHMF